MQMLHVQDLRIRAIVWSNAIYWNLWIWQTVRRILSMRLPVHCWGWASSLHRPLCAVSRNFFELPVVCSHILGVQVSVPPHCKGTSGCLSIWALYSTDCMLVLTVASSSLLTHLAICRWLYSLHFFCSYCGLFELNWFSLLHSQPTC